MEKSMTAVNAKLTDILRQAAEKLEQMDLGSAIALYQKAAQLVPDNAGVLMGLAMTYNRSGQATLALQILERLWKAASDAKGKDAGVFKASVLAQLGLARQQLGQLKSALLAYEQAQKLMPSKALEERIVSIKPLAASPEPVQQLVLSARQQAAAGQLESALKLFNAALQLHADSVEALHGLAMVQRQRGLFDVALPLLQKAVMLMPDRADLYNDLGMIFQDRGDFSKAVSFHKRALKIKPDFVFALVNMGVAYKRQEKNSEAISAYQSALKLAPEFPELHNNLGNILRIDGQIERAKWHLEKAISLRPGYVDAIENMKSLEQGLAGNYPNESSIKLKPSAKKTAPAKKAATISKKDAAAQTIVNAVEIAPAPRKRAAKTVAAAVVAKTVPEKKPGAEAKKATVSKKAEPVSLAKSPSLRSAKSAKAAAIAIDVVEVPGQPL